MNVSDMQVKLSLNTAGKGDFTVTTDGIFLHLCFKCGMPIPMSPYTMLIHGSRITIHPEIFCPRCKASYSVFSSNIVEGLP